MAKKYFLYIFCNTLPNLSDSVFVGDLNFTVSRLKPLMQMYIMKKAKTFRFSLFCTPSGARTLDPNIKSVVLYQLS